MTREEAIGQLTRLRSYCLAETGTDDRDVAAIWKADAEALSIAIAALRGPTREQVEKMRGEWEWYDEDIGSPLEGTEREWGWRCSKCKTVLPDDFDDPDNSPVMSFCPFCGVPMIDEAVPWRSTVSVPEKARSVGEPRA